MDRIVAANQEPSPASYLSATTGAPDVRQRKMNAIDRFLRKHEVDVGRSLAVLFFAGAVMAFYTMAGQVIASTRIPFDSNGPIFGITLNFGAPIYIILGLGLWRHKSWSRTLLLVFVWLAAGVLTLMLLAIPFTEPGRVKLVIGSQTIRNPSVWTAIIYGILVAPLYAFLLGVLHSKKAQEEFKKSNQPPDRR